MKLKLKTNFLHMTELVQENKLLAFTDKLTPSPIKFKSEITATAENILETIDFPTTRVEAWKYTRVGKISNIQHQAPSKNILNLSNSLPGEFSIVSDSINLVFENGNLMSNLSTKELPAGLKFKSISECSADELTELGNKVKLENDVFSSINTKFASEGFYLTVDNNITIDKNIQIIHLVSDSNQVINYRNFIKVGKFSKANIAIGYFSKNSENVVSNILTEVLVEENAFVTIDKIQKEDGIYQVNTDQVHQQKDSTFTINTITLNGALVRNNLNIEVDGANCTTNLHGAYILKDNQHVDNHTYVDHLAPHCESNELYKGVIDDKATGVFNGKVMVRKDSQKINAFQSNGNVLLSDNASMNSKPELEIYADDVKCSHGSTTGQLDDEAIFYLRARGISEKGARDLMVAAFIGDVLGKIENEEVLSFVQKSLQERFGWEF